MFDHVQRMPVAFFMRTRTGALVSRLNNDVIGAQSAISRTLSGVVMNVVSLVLTLAVMVSTSWQVTLISLVLLWSMRAVVAAELVVAVLMWRRGELPDSVGWVAVAVPLVAWVLAEVALLRALVRPLPADGADVPVDEALRTWTAHLVAAAVSVLALLPLGALLLAAGIDLGDRVTEGIDLLPVALVAGGFAGLAAGLALAVFLVTWLKPVRVDDRALTT